MIIHPHLTIDPLLAMIMVSFISGLSGAALLFGLVQAAAIKQQGISPLRPSDISFYRPFACYAAAAYCPPDQVSKWQCGENCNVNGHFSLNTVCGNGTDAPLWYVGYAAKQKLIIAAHRGWDVGELLLSLELPPTSSLDPNQFPNVPRNVTVHGGFALAQERSAQAIRGAVQNLRTRFPRFSVTIVGHSGGAAVALLDAVYLMAQLNVGVGKISVIAFGLPRVGNQAFVDFVDERIHVVHINNREDPIPTLPRMSLGYHHASGEIHIQDSAAWVSCPGQDNPSGECIVGDIGNNTSKASLNDNLGPYDGVIMSC